MKEKGSGASPQPSVAPTAKGKQAPPPWGPYIHQINQGKLDTIQATQQLISTEPRYGGPAAVRAVEGSLQPSPAGQREAIEFYTHVEPSDVHATNREAYWYRKEGEYVPIVLTRIARPGMPIEVLVEIDRSKTP